MIVFLLYWASNVLRDGIFDMWKFLHYFTNWAITITTMTYTFIFVGHGLNGDLYKNKTIYKAPLDPAPPLKTNDPHPRSIFRLWKWGTVWYGLMQVSNFFVFLGFMFIELPQYVIAYNNKNYKMDKY
jgi:hypothetical protein